MPAHGEYGKNIIQSIRWPVLLEMKSRWEGLDISFLYSSFSTASCVSLAFVYLRFNAIDDV